MPADRAPAIADRIDAVLPQQQCKRCGYDACRPYAEAIALGAEINRCPPGGDAVLGALAALTGRPVVGLAPECGAQAPLAVARIDEAWCIGCTLCIDACPVDAIIGAAKRMHAVLPSLCTGCELCIAPCPVDCIVMTPAGRAWSSEDARMARARFEWRQARPAAHGAGRSPPPPQDAVVAGVVSADDAARSRRKATVDAALARARARRAAADATR